MEAIRAATSVAADCLKISGRKGALKPRLDADVFDYLYNPIKDPAALRKPVLVINGGKVFLNRLPGAEGRHSRECTGDPAPRRDVLFAAER